MIVWSFADGVNYNYCSAPIKIQRRLQLHQ
jgi:hypothetical protein